MTEFPKEADDREYRGERAKIEGRHALSKKPWEELANNVGALWLFPLPLVRTIGRDEDAHQDKKKAGMMEVVSVQLLSVLEKEDGCHSTRPGT